MIFLNANYSASSKVLHSTMYIGGFIVVIFNVIVLYLSLMMQSVFERTGSNQGNDNSVWVVVKSVTLQSRVCD